MKRGTYIRTPDILKKMSLSHLGKTPHNKGSKLSLEDRGLISKATKKAMTKEVRLKISLFAKSRKFTEEHRQAISLGNKGKTKGKLHYRWKGGIRRIGDVTYTSTEYKEWRTKVFKRDDFICRGCKIKGKRLQAHHILPKCKFPERMFDIENGITLCEDCHKNTSSYGVNKKYTLDKTQK